MVFEERIISFHAVRLCSAASMPSHSSGISLMGNTWRSVSLENSLPHTVWVESESFTPFSLRSEEHTSELQSRQYLVCRLLLEKKKTSHPYIRLSLVILF